MQELPPPAEPAQLDPPVVELEGDSLAWALPRLEQLAEEIGSAVTFEALPAELGGFYELRTRRIVVNHCRSINGQVATLIHELAHSLVRHDRQPEDPALSYAEEELVVESVAYTVCGACGLDVAGAAVPYLAAWAERAELETIERTAKLIDRLARQIEEPLLTASDATGTSALAATFEAAAA